MKLTLKQLRQHAIASSLFPPTTLRRAIDRLGFVQADPIRSPARAQDLTLRHRVKNYRAGDLERRYSSLDLEEDLLYAYGFMPYATWALLHPRQSDDLTAAERNVLEIVSAHKQIHPRDLDQYLGHERQINAWGGYSKATTRTLQALHYRGLLRVARRVNGIRLYEEPTRAPQAMEPVERLRQLVLRIAAILSPLAERSLRAVLQQSHRLQGVLESTFLARAAPALKVRQSAVTDLLDSGDLASAVVDGVRYVWPNEPAVCKKQREKPPNVVRFLAPFDPVVWDRRRFEHLWGWQYRFEAYTPEPKRKLGYYAMPLLWRDDVIGWVNISNRQGQLKVEAGFVKDRPTEPAFEKQFDEEVARFQHFLHH